MIARQVWYASRLVRAINVYVPSCIIVIKKEQGFLPAHSLIKSLYNHITYGPLLAAGVLMVGKGVTDGMNVMVDVAMAAL